MLRWAQNYFISLKPVFIDGTLYVLIAIFQYLQTEFGSDDAEKFLAPMALFYIKLVVGPIAAALLALKMFRSTSFADHKEEKKLIESGNTEMLNKKDFPQ
jgi:hypothetical protein